MTNFYNFYLLFISHNFFNPNNLLFNHFFLKFIIFYLLNSFSNTTKKFPYRKKDEHYTDI